MTDFSDSISMYEACLLHSKSDRLLRLVVGRELEPYSITMMQWLLLMTVDKGPSAGMRMTELSEQLDVTMPQITALMNDLVEQKLTKQKINSSDRRSRRLSITSTGKKRLEEIDDSVDRALKKWLKQVPEADLRGYYETLKQMVELELPNEKA